jgi:hypothetical protein
MATMTIAKTDLLNFHWNVFKTIFARQPWGHVILVIIKSRWYRKHMRRVFRKLYVFTDLLWMIR